MRSSLRQMHRWPAKVVLIAIAASCSAPPSTPSPAPTRTPPPTTSAPDAAIGAVTTVQPTAVRASASTDAVTIVTLRSGITLPVTDRREGFVGILTPCEMRGWVAESDVATHARAAAPARRLAEATIVVDAGHGGALPGAVGPSGLREADPNLDIARRVAAKLDGVRVVLSRNDDFTAGLGFRTALANSLGAHALVSVHNNADPDGPSERPGTETYYQAASGDSKRLAGLLYEEVVRVLSPFDAAWVADRDAGAKYRLSAAGRDYYALLRGSKVPAVIVEGLYIVNAPEEALLRRSAVTDAIAGAIAAGLRRFFQTTEPGSGFVEPYPREPGPSGRLPLTCNDPAPT